MNSRLSVRFGGVCAALACAVLVACGGGGGGGGGTALVPTQTTSTPTATGTPVGPASQATTAPVTAGSAATLNFGAISSGGQNVVTTATLKVTPSSAPGGTTASVTLAGTAPTGVVAPAARSIHKVTHQSALGVQSTLAYFTIQFSQTVTILTPPAFTITVPGTPNGNWYVLFDDPSNVLTNGWSEIAQLTVSGNTLSFTPSANFPQAITLVGGQPYYFAIATTGTSPITTPSPAPSPTATATASSSASSPPAASSGVTLLPASNSVARGNLLSPLLGGIAAALSDAPDYAPNQTLARTTISVGTGTSAQARSALATLGYETRPITAARTPVEMRPPNDAQTLKIAMRAHRVQGAPTRHALASTIPTNPTVGSTANIWVAVFAIGSSSGTFTAVPATLEAQTTHGNIWIDNTLLTDASSPFSAGGATTAAATIGTDFENAYASDTAHFGTPDYPANAPAMQTVTACDSSGNSTTSSTSLYITEPSDKRINVMVLNSANLGSGVGGYFASANYFTQAALNCANTASTKYYTNEAPMIYVGYFDSASSNYELNEDLVRGTAHEFQHLINFVNHGLLASAPNSEESAYNEGLSMLAQDLAVARMYPSVSHDSLDAMPHAAAYLQHPENYSISGFVGIDQSSWGGDGVTAHYNCGGGCYGGSFMFMRYLYDRCGGDAFSTSMESSGKFGWANLQASCATTETGNQLLEDFGMSLAVNQLGITPSSSRYSSGTIKVSGSYASPLAGFNATVLPGVGRFTVNGNASGTARAPVGGFTFFDLSAASGAFSLTDTSPSTGFTLLGGVAQH